VRIVCGCWLCGCFSVCCKASYSVNLFWQEALGVIEYLPSRTSDQGAATRNYSPAQKGGDFRVQGGVQDLLLGRAYLLINQPLKSFGHLAAAAANGKGDDKVVSAACFLLAHILYFAGASSPSESQRGAGGKDERKEGVMISGASWDRCCGLVASLQTHLEGVESENGVHSDYSKLLGLSHRLKELLPMTEANGMAGDSQGAGGRSEGGEGVGGKHSEREWTEVEGVEGLLREVLKREPNHLGATCLAANFLWQTKGRGRRERERALLLARESKLIEKQQVCVCTF
jgi:hypothetical protein